MVEAENDNEQRLTTCCLVGTNVADLTTGADVSVLLNTSLLTG